MLLRFLDNLAGAMYGPDFEGYIHVHHCRPLCEIASDYQVNPVEDLRPVCPNCHAAIHRRTPPFSIDEMRAILARQQIGNLEGRSGS
jgi:5-methylcytosine-specific restriction protein A